MRLRKPLLALALVALILSVPRVASAAPHAKVTDAGPTLNFPESITFQATIESSTPITSVILEYGTHQLTCGTVVAKAFPQFTPGPTVTAEWTWEMKQSGSLPPGATLWWRWRYRDENGAENVSEQKSISWLDSLHSWQTVTSGAIHLHWYSGDKAFADDLLNAALTGLARLQNDAGLAPSGPIHLYIYASTQDLKDAILYEPTWTGGMAYPDHDVVIIGISASDLEWGRRTVAHELTHVLIGHLTFSCLGDVPTWLNEGLAVYSEGELDRDSKTQFDEAVKNDELLSVRSLSGGFSEVPSKAYLSYSQSYSLVKFLIETYGQAQMNSLLTALRDGNTIDDALSLIYGFDIGELEMAWRKAIGASPQIATGQATAQPAPTFVPTYVPFSGAAVVQSPTPYVIPTSSIAQPTPGPGGPPITLTLILAAVCCALTLLVGVVGLGVYLASQRQKEKSDE